MILYLCYIAMKRSAILTCCFIFVFIHTGIYFGFYFLRKQIRSEIKLQIKQALPESEITTLVFTSEQFQKIKWIDHKEFQWNGSFFDIIVIQKKNNWYVLKVINDKQEEKLFADLSQLTDQQICHNKSKNKLKQLGKFFELKFLFDGGKSPEPTNYFIQKVNAIKIDRVLNGYISTPAQPPEFSFDCLL